MICHACSKDVDPADSMEDARGRVWHRGCALDALGRTAVRADAIVDEETGEDVTASAEEPVVEEAAEPEEPKQGKWKCRGCGYSADEKWLGPCKGCGRDYDIEKNRKAEREEKSMADAAVKKIRRISSGIPELDKVLSGGFVRGSSLFITGGEGVGKTTILMQAIAHVCKETKRKAIYASGEQRNEDIAYVAERVGALSEYVIPMGNEDNADAVITKMEDTHPIMLVIDSLATIALDDCEGDFGSSSQLSALADRFSALAKQSDIIIVLVGHRTAAENPAGPRRIRFLVDVVLDMDKEIFIGENGKPDPEVKGLRTIRCAKNRYGVEDLEEMLEMAEDGSGLKTTSRRKSKILFKRYDD